MAYEIVVMTEEGMTKVNPDCIKQWVEDMGTSIIGVSSNPHTRAELQGHPKIAGFNGPCWGGTTANGEPIIRYEDSQSYAALSF